MHRFLIFLPFVFCAVFTALAAEPVSELDVISRDFESPPSEMMRAYLLDEISTVRVNWEKRYALLKTADEVQKYQRVRKEFLWKQMGRLWKKTPLNAEITKTYKKSSAAGTYRTELIRFESQPGFHVTGAMFLPDETKFKPPYPAVLVVCGHAGNGKEYEQYQQVTALAAINGIAAFIIDPVDQGERIQRFGEDGKAARIGVHAHNLLGAPSILLGRNTASFELWDMIRALDYIESRTEIYGERVAVMGNSGGGTQTSYIMALDERVEVAIPCCYICGLYDDLPRTLGPQDAEQNIFGQLGFGLDHVDYCIMRAPNPTLIQCVTEDFFPVADTWKAYRNAKRIYDRFGFAERISIMENDNKHGWHKNMRESAVRWLLRWLADRDEPIAEHPEMPIFKQGELHAAPNGKVMDIPGERTAFEINRDYNEELRKIRTERNSSRSREELCDVIRNLAGVRPLEDIRELKFATLGKPDSIPAELSEIAGIEKFLLGSKDGRIVIPGLIFTSVDTDADLDDSQCLIFLHDKGKAADLNKVAEFIKAGNKVIAVDLRGLGETQAVGSNYYEHEYFGTDGTDFYLAYLLGKTYVGMRTEDLLAIAKYFSGPESNARPKIYAEGDITTLVAAHANFLEPSMFSGFEYKEKPRTWYDFVNAGVSFYPITNIVHGALLEYDTDDLIDE